MGEGEIARVDFYHLTRDPAEALIPRLAEQTLNAGERLLVVSSDSDQLDRISQALWDHAPESFLAHGRAGGPHDGRQPILLASEPKSANGALYGALADGVWREGAETRFERVFLLFGESTLHQARGCWTTLGKIEGVERRYWKQDNGRWREGP